MNKTKSRESRVLHSDAVLRSEEAVQVILRCTLRLLLDCLLSFVVYGDIHIMPSIASPSRHLTEDYLWKCQVRGPSRR